MLQHPLALVNRVDPHLMKQSTREVFLLRNMWVESVLFLTISARCGTVPAMDYF